MKLDADQIPGGLILLDSDNSVIDVNRTFCDWLALSPEDFRGQPPETWMPRASRMYYLGHVLPALRLHGQVDEVLLSFCGRPGDDLPVIMNAARAEGSGAAFQLVVLPMQRRNLVEQQLQQARDLAERAVAEKDEALQRVKALADVLEARQLELAALNEQLERLATQDPLTGLGNRRVFDREIDASLSLFRRSGMTFSLILADADHFKQVNDQHGHDAGDQILCQLGRCLAAGMRDIDVVVRMGGEEFALILPDTSIEQARIVAERKRQQVQALQTDCGALTMSFGLTGVRSGDDAEALYKRADRALYDAKRSGRNRVHSL